MRYEHWYDSENSHQLYYLKSKRWLQNLISDWELENADEIGLTPELTRLANILDKLERSVFQIAVFGMVGRGKSSVLNALTNQEVFRSGALHGVTQSVESIEINLDNQVKTKQASLVAASLPTISSNSYSNILTASNSPTISQPPTSSQDWQGSIQFFDTPGIDEVDGRKQTEIAYHLGNQVDLILFVISGDLNQVEYEAIAELKKQGKPLLLVFNKIDQYPALDRLAIYTKISDQRVKELIAPSEIVMVAAAPVELRGTVKADGSIVRQKVKVKPLIEPLKQKIAEIINHKGKQLIVLNNAVAAQKIHEQIVQLKISRHDLAASRIITNLVFWKAVLIGLNQVAIADLLLGLTLDMSLILMLSSLYGVSLPSSGALSLLPVITLGLGAIGAVDLLLHLNLSYLLSTSDLLLSVKEHLPFLDSWLIGACQGIIAGVSMIIIGQVAKQQFLQSLSWRNYPAQQIIQETIRSLKR